MPFKEECPLYLKDFVKSIFALFPLYSFYFPFKNLILTSHTSLKYIQYLVIRYSRTSIVNTSQ